MRHFATIVVLDFEYEIKPGNPPNVLCMVAYVLDENLQHVDTIRQWRGEFGPTPPFNIGPDTLVVGYSLWAEMTCFLALHWQLPMWVYDLHTAYLSATNILLPYEPDEDRGKRAQAIVNTLAAATASRAGKISTRRRWRKPSARVAGTCTAKLRCSTIAKRTLRTRLSYCVDNCAATSRRAPLDPRIDNTVERLQRQVGGVRAATRYSGGHAAVEFDAGEQVPRLVRAAGAIRSEPRRRRANLRRRRHVEHRTFH